MNEKRAKKAEKSEEEKEKDKIHFCGKRANMTNNRKEVNMWLRKNEKVKKCEVT